MNLMLDATPMYPESFHPHIAYQGRRPDFKGQAKSYARTQRPPKYYWIDFGISTRYESASSRSLEDRLWGGDHSVPEFQGNEGPHDPFPTDVYYVGNLIKIHFVEVRHLRAQFLLSTEDPGHVRVRVYGISCGGYDSG